MWFPLSVATTSTTNWCSCADDAINKDDDNVDEVADVTTVLDKGLLDQVFAIMNSAGVDYKYVLAKTTSIFECILNVFGPIQRVKISKVLLWIHFHIDHCGSILFDQVYLYRRL